MKISPSLPERKRIVATDNEPVRGHELAQISERVPGDEPSNSTISLNNGRTYEVRYWLCLGCGQERNRKRDFVDHCNASLTIARTDGGYSIRECKTCATLAETMSVHLNRDDRVYTVRGESSVPHRVELRGQRCTCSDYRDHHSFCKHLRRVDIEVRTGTLPDVRA